MRDGVKLHTRVVLPKREGQFPTVLDRSPYGYNHSEILIDVYTLLGFAAVGQDMRGTLKSEGNFTLFHGEGDDGMDTINWIREQPWSDGRIFTFGGSADGTSHYTPAQSHYSADRTLHYTPAGSHYVGCPLTFDGPVVVVRQASRAWTC
jgi:uncharacterized protein